MTAISTSIGAQNGLLVKDRLALERARNLDMVIFDKTGTLTRGIPALSGVATVPGGSESDLLADAAAVEANSEHPLAKAVVAEAKHRNLADAASYRLRISTRARSTSTSKRQESHGRWTASADRGQGGRASGS